MTVNGHVRSKEVNNKDEYLGKYLVVVVGLLDAFFAILPKKDGLQNFQLCLKCHLCGLGQNN